MGVKINKWYLVSLSALLFIGISLGSFPIFENSGQTSKWYIWSFLIPSYIMAYIMYVRSLYVKKAFISFLIIFSVYLFVRFVGNFGFSLFLIRYLLFVGTLFLIYNIVNLNKKYFDYIIFAFLLVCLLLFLYGLGQYFKVLETNSSFIVCGTYNNPAEYAATISISTPFILYFTRCDKMLIRKIAWITLSLAFIAIVLSESRTGIVVFSSVACAYVFRYKCLHLRWWKIIVSLCLVVFIFGGLYYVKKDSADGRLLVWRCTLNMIKERPLFGYGHGGFGSQYMSYQADYFSNNPVSRYAMLADNVRHPFNEFLLLIVEFGLCSFVLVAILFSYLIWIYLKQKNDLVYTCVLSLFGIGIFSCFSYPLSIPFTWLVLGLSIGTLLNFSNERNKQIHFNKCMICVFCVFVCFFLIFTVKRGYYEYRWYQLKQLPAFSYRNTIISEYGFLYNYLSDDPYFLYDYAAEMNYLEAKWKAERLIETCEKYVNDYNVQMLKAEIRKKTCRLEDAEKSYILASQMCPSKFAPLYELERVYEMQGKSDLAVEIAREIVNKKVKIPFAKIDAIKEIMQNKLEEQDFTP